MCLETCRGNREEEEEVRLWRDYKGGKGGEEASGRRKDEEEGTGSGHKGELRRKRGKTWCILSETCSLMSELQCCLWASCVYYCYYILIVTTMFRNFRRIFKLFK